MHALILVAALFSTPAFAMFEVKGHYDVLTATPSSFNAQMEDFVKNAPDVAGITGYGADATFKFPVLPIVVGLRYETLSFKKSGAASISGTPVTTTAELSGSRTSLLAGWRLIQTPVAYLGVLGHYSATQNMKFGLKSVNAVGFTSEESFKAEVGTGYGMGAEAGLTFGHAVVGAELGYTMLKATKFSDKDGDVLDDSQKPVTMDLTGPYAKISVGGRF